MFLHMLLCILTLNLHYCRLVLAEIPPGHFTHIIMDEVGQALETEALIPLAGLATHPNASKFCCQVIMAGDPKQLGPILQSPIAAKFGLGESLGML